MNVPAVRDGQGEILQLLGLPPNHIHSKALLLLADRYGLDPLLKEIVVIPGKGPFVGVKGAVSVALRSGLLDGMEADDCWDTDTHWCVRCIVWRKDMNHPAAKVIGRVAKTEKKDWPLEIARARGVRAALSYAFNIHDDYGESEDQWAPPPADVERAEASVAAAAPQEVNGEPAAAPKKKRRVNRTTGEVVDVADTSERTPGAGEPAGTGETSASVTPSRPDPAPDSPDSRAEPATVVVGGHTLAQKIAMAARDAGIDDDQTRHDVIRAASRGTYARGSDIPDDGYDPDLVDRIFEAFEGLKTGAVDLRYAPDGTPQLFKVRR